MIVVLLKTGRLLLLGENKSGPRLGRNKIRRFAECASGSYYVIFFFGFNTDNRVSDTPLHVVSPHSCDNR